MTAAPRRRQRLSGCTGALLAVELFLFWVLQVATIVLVRFEIAKM